jgi:hypothetical protein
LQTYFPFDFIKLSILVGVLLFYKAFKNKAHFQRSYSGFSKALKIILVLKNYQKVYKFINYLKRAVYARFLFINGLIWHQKIRLPCAIPKLLIKKFFLF